MWYVWYISSLMQMVNDAVLKAYLARWNSTILLQKRPTFFLLRPELVYNLRQGRIYHANTALLHLSLLSIWLIDLYMKIYIYIYVCIRTLQRGGLMAPSAYLFRPSFPATGYGPPAWLRTKIQIFLCSISAIACQPTNHHLRFQRSPRKHLRSGPLINDSI